MENSSITIEKKNGVVFTPIDLCNFMSEHALEHFSKKKTDEIVVLEPSSGDGALALSIIEALTQSGFQNITLYAFDINNEYLTALEDKIQKKYPNVNLTCICQDFIEFAYSNKTIKADIIISNPPYVRTQNLDEKYIEFAKGELNLSGKIDLYQIFICCLKNVLKEDGIVSIVVSNKFLSNKTGRALRQYIESNFALFELIDFGDTKLFDASVLPVVMIMSNSFTLGVSSSYISVYSSNEKNITDFNLFDAIKNKSNLCIKDNQLYSIRYGELVSCDYNWSIKTSEDSSFIELADKNTKFVFRDFAKIKVGIKTTADKVFISKNWDDLGDDKPELLRPLITHKIANQYFTKDKTSFMVLYPYKTVNGKKAVVCLDDFPKTKKYLLSHFKELDSRKYIKESQKEWFEIWVPHSPKQWDKNKIVFRDICEHPTFWYSNSGDIVNGDCYWFDFDERVDLDLVFLMLAIANSTFIEKYYDIKFNNKLYSGRRRFMTQYVEKFPIFDINSSIAKEIISIIKKASLKQSMTQKDIDKVNQLVFDGFSQKN